MRTGVWLVGARGSVSVTTLIGALAVRASLASPIGCVTELADLHRSNLPGLPELVFGGHDITDVDLVKKAQALAASGVVPGTIVDSVANDLSDVESELRRAPDHHVQAEGAQQIARDLVRFRERNQLARVVVINLSSTEPLIGRRPEHSDLEKLCDAMTHHDKVLPPSSLYAFAAFQAGCSYVDFTPSTGARLPALGELADRQGVPFAGNDGKTGETLLKSVLAPMFTMRNLPVHSWSGLNLLGGDDGANLSDPAANAVKVASKQRVLQEILGYQPEGHTRIDYVPDIGDLKTAWDLVTFSGFLGTRMRLEFTWHGCDSALAAPLVLDLARLTAAAHAAGLSGPLTELAFFFKDPIGDLPHSLTEQWRALCDWVGGWPS